jgi:hypothetical protein
MTAWGTGLAMIAGFAALATVAVSAAQLDPSRRAYKVLRGDVVDQVIGPWQISGWFRAVETREGTRIRNLTIQGVTATDLQRDGIRIRGDVDGVNIHDFKLQMRSEPQSSPNLPIGIAVQTGHGIAISDGDISGFQMIRVEGQYTNGDGIASERDVDGLTIKRVTSSDNSDGGFDLKSQNTVLDDLTAARNGRNYRFWGTVDAGTLTSIDPRGAHIWVHGGARVHIRKLIARSTTKAPLLNIDGPSEVIIDSCELNRVPGTKLVVGGPAPKLGQGCTI